MQILYLEDDMLAVGYLGTTQGGISKANGDRQAVRRRKKSLQDIPESASSN
jgi:hypothetical protein